MNESAWVEHNVRAHDTAAAYYDDQHGEIFNPIEQLRLAESIAWTVHNAVQTKGKALDFGCGTGNLSRHLYAYFDEVHAVDVSAAMVSAAEAKLNHLSATNGRFGVFSPMDWGVRWTHGAEGRLFDEQYDFIGAYSVLHHIPDYIDAIRRLARMIRPGGVLYLDHEDAPISWNQSSEYRKYKKSGKTLKRMWDGLGLFNFTSARWREVRRMRRTHPRYSPDGDIHIWPDDHIEWDNISNALAEEGFEIVRTTDYLLYKIGYREDVYQKYKDRCADMRLVVARRK